MPTFGQADFCLLELDSRTRKIMYAGFAKDEFDDATLQYAAMEKENEGDDSIHIVLVSVDSLRNLNRAFPSYFLDSSGFIDVMNLQLYNQPPRAADSSSF